MGPGSLKLDARRRIVIVNGRSAVLQEKGWRVLSLLRARAPEVVSRQEIIDTVWQGNFRTGEKGLNQAVWAVRRALSDDPREPEFIRTVPRVGYQWIHSGILPRASREATTGSRFFRALSGVSVLIIAALAVTYFPGSPSVSGADSTPSATPGTANVVATNAYLVDRDIHVELANGCKRILKNANYANIGTPVLSSDGTELAVTVRESSSCRLVTIGLANGERRDFENCPAI